MATLCAHLYLARGVWASTGVPTGEELVVQMWQGSHILHLPPSNSTEERQMPREFGRPYTEIVTYWLYFSPTENICLVLQQYEFSSKIGFKIKTWKWP